MAYKRNRHDDHDETAESYSVPYKDAKPGTDEIPLDDLDNFIVPGRDEHGAHQTITINCPPLLVHQMDVIVRSQLFPYINRESMARHAFVRHMRWLQNIRPEQLSQHIAPTIESLLERCFQSQMRKKVQAAFEALRETLLQAERDSEWLEVIRLCYYVKERLQGVDPTSVWQRRAWKQFINEFGHYMAEASYIMQKESMMNKGLGQGDERLDLEIIGQLSGSTQKSIPAPAPVITETTTKRLRLRNEPDPDNDLVN